jgi:two-component system sensor histidine kinase TctE
VLLMNLAAGALAWMLAPPHLREAVLRTLVLVEMVFALACVGWCGSRSAMACSR